MLSQEQFLAISANDANLYYGSTFVRCKDKKQGKNWEWIQVGSFGGAKKPTTADIYFENDGPTVMNKTVKVKDFDWDFSIPEARFYNFKDSTIRFVRTAARQWKKGLCPDAFFTESTLLYLQDCGIIPPAIYSMNAFTFSCKDLNTLFKQQKIEQTLEQSINEINKQEVLARVVNDSIVISQGVKSKNPSLWLQSLLVGEFDVKHDKILLQLPQFDMEVSSAFAKLGIPITHQ